MSRRPRRVHFIGIGGIGLSAIARVLIARGDQVAGSDLHASPITDELAKLGAKIFIGHRAENVGDVDMVLATSAATEDNPEILQARRRGIRILKRYDFFPELTAGKQVIAVAGTHGKTTTTGMVAAILLNAGLDPTAIVGGSIPELGGNGRAGRGEYFVIEADEYDRAFLGLRPSIAVVTSIEMDHPDMFRDVNEVAGGFREFMSLVARDGLIVGCGDDERVSRELQSVDVPVARYGFGMHNDWRAVDLKPNARGGTNFAVQRGTDRLGDFELQIPGKHNVLNALAALVAAHRAGADLKSAQETLRNFRGAARRFEIKGEFAGITIVDDYAHHPSEIRATLAAARERFPGRTIWAVFQPHTFSRTHALLDDFTRAFGDADRVIVTDIFGARERDNGRITSRDLVQRMTKPNVTYLRRLEETADYLSVHLKPGDILLTLGAGDVYRIGEWVLAGLSKQPRASASAEPESKRSPRKSSRASKNLNALRIPPRDDAAQRDDLRPDGDARRRAGSIEASAALGIRAKRNESLAPHTTFRIGGPADFFVEAKTISDLIEYVKLAREHGVEIFVLGNGSNVLVLDGGVRGLVIENHCDQFSLSVIGTERAILTAESGVPLPNVANRMARQGWSGLEWAIGVPGTVGAAVVGNAGAQGGCIADNLLQVSLLDAAGAMRKLSIQDLAFGYRDSRFKHAKSEIILSADFELRQDDPQVCIARMIEYSEHRRRTQPTEPSVGSMFKNPPGDFAGRLIEQAGLKGTRVGKVEVSQVHANFFVNQGGATAKEVLRLIDIVREQVRKKFGIELELEIELVGEPGG